VVIEPDSIQWTGQTIIWNTLTGAGHDSGGEDDIRILTKPVPIPEPSFLLFSGFLFAAIVRLSRRS
jgi:hypothetical protein